MKRVARVLSLLALVTSSFCVAFADDAKPKAITPEVQTAKWAVKWWGPRHEQKLKDLKAQKKVDLLTIARNRSSGVCRMVKSRGSLRS
jgi:hypothetical protein